MNRNVRTVRRTLSLALTILVLAPAVALAQSPWERAAANLEASFTGPVARSLALVAIVIGGLMFMFGEGGAEAPDLRHRLRRGPRPLRRPVPRLAVLIGALGRYYPEAIMTATPDAIRPVYKAIHRPLTLAGVDRRLFFLALLLGAATFNLFYSFLAGLLTFAGLVRLRALGHAARSGDAAHPPRVGSASRPL